MLFALFRSLPEIEAWRRLCSAIVSKSQWKSWGLSRQNLPKLWKIVSNISFLNTITLAGVKHFKKVYRNCNIFQRLQNFPQNSICNLINGFLIAPGSETTANMIISFLWKLQYIALMVKFYWYLFFRHRFMDSTFDNVVLSWTLSWDMDYRLNNRSGLNGRFSRCIENCVRQFDHVISLASW